jgi:hypothetical protein
MCMKMMHQPKMSMKAFFELPKVKAAQEIQKRHPYGSAKHMMAYMEICAMALDAGARDYCKPEDY